MQLESQKCNAKNAGKSATPKIFPFISLCCILKERKKASKQAKASKKEAYGAFGADQIALKMKLPTLPFPTPKSHQGKKKMQILSEP